MPARRGGGRRGSALGGEMEPWYPLSSTLRGAGEEMLGTL